MISGRTLLIFSEFVFVANNYGTCVSYMILVSQKIKNSKEEKNKKFKKHLNFKKKIVAEISTNIKEIKTFPPLIVLLDP